MTNIYSKEMQTAKEVAILAGQAIMQIYESEEYELRWKEDDSPLTEADRRSNDIIVKKLKKDFPDYGILSEEEKDSAERLVKKFCFVIDPLDGTKEFIKRNGQFTVNIALSVDHRTVMGVIYVPVTGELYYAAKGYGAYLEKDGKQKKLSVSSQHKEKKDLRVVMSSSHGCQKMDELLQKYQLSNFVKVGSSLKGCMIAAGDADIYYRHNPTMEWDTAAMQCIVEEAGGIFRQMDDTEMLYNRENSLNHKGFYILNHWNNKL